MKRAKWLFGVLFLAALFAIPSLAVGQDDPSDSSDVPGQVVPEDPAADDQAPADPSIEPPQVLADPAPKAGDVAPAPVADDPSSLAAPPVTELSRFSDSDRAPLWQQRDNWRERGWFYQRRIGWFLHRGDSWWQWRGRWTPCGPPTTWSPPVVRPVPTANPGGPVFNPVRDAVTPIQAPQTVPQPTQQNRRAVLIQRALRVCQNRYAHAVFVLRALRRQGRITFPQYQQGIRLALVRRAVCRRQVIRLFNVRH
jgi:hypothetical protein